MKPTAAAMGICDKRKTIIDYRSYRQMRKKRSTFSRGTTVIWSSTYVRRNFIREFIRELKLEKLRRIFSSISYPILSDSGYLTMFSKSIQLVPER